MFDQDKAPFSPSDDLDINISEEQDFSSSSIQGKLTRYASLKTRALAMIQYLRGFGGQDCRSLSYKIAWKLKNCATYLKFRNYFTIDKICLVEVCTCKVYLLCPFCAARRASKLIESYVPKHNQVMAENPGLRPYLITLTVKNGEDPAERFYHLVRAHKTLQQRRRNGLRGKGSKSLWTHVMGAVGAYEVTNRGNGFHPHIHLVALADIELPTFLDEEATRRQGRAVWRCPQLEQEWLEITGDSSVVDVRPFASDQPVADSFAEVFKYALKFSGMSLENNWGAYLALDKTRMVFSYGLYRGVEVPEDLTDQVPLEELPYVELLYRWFPRKGYTLAQIDDNQVEEIAAAGASPLPSPASAVGGR